MGLLIQLNYEVISFNTTSGFAYKVAARHAEKASGLWQRVYEYFCICERPKMKKKRKKKKITNGTLL